MTLSYLDTLYAYDKLLGFLKGRCDCNIGLKKLVIRSCRVDTEVKWMSKLAEVVKEVDWDRLNLVDREYDAIGGSENCHCFGYYGGP